MFLPKGCHGCESGWEDIGGTCFGLFTESMPWADARTFCQGHGGDLAKVADADMLRALYEYIMTYGECCGLFGHIVINALSYVYESA